MSQGITSQIVKRIFEYPNNDHKNYLRAKQKYGLTELRLDPNKQWLFVHNRTLHQVDIIDVATNEHLQTLHYQQIIPNMYVHKGVDLCIEKKWLILGGDKGWLIWNYETQQLLQSKTYDHSNIVSAKISPDLQELWVLVEDEKIVIYNSSTWEILDEILIQGTYNFPLVWHPDGKHFLFTQMEQGGTDIFVGHVANRTIDRSKSIFSNSYIIANLTFSVDGEYVLFTDAGTHTYKFPSLKQCYSLDDVTEKVDSWESPQYPTQYSLVNVISWKKYKDCMLTTNLGSVMGFFPINDNKDYFYFVPLKRLGYRTTIEGIIDGSNEGIFYFSDYLGGIYSLDISEAMQEMIY